MEIRFRGKQMDSGEWYHGYYVKAPRWGDAHYIIMDYHGPSTIAHEVDGDTLGRWTGLKDRDGADIFEGDILEWGHYKRICRVSWLEDTARFLYIVPHKPDPGLIYPGEANACAVIGNIHDNPELLIEGVAA